MKMNRLSSSGVQPRPSRPIVCMTTPSSMNSTEISARLRTPFGATSGSRRPASRKTMIPISAAATAIRAILLNEAKKSCQRRTSLIFGKSRPSTVVPFLSVRAGGLEAGIGEGGRHVLQLPDEQAEVGDDDRQAERRARDPTHVLDEVESEEEQAETGEVAEQHGAHHQSERDSCGDRDETGGDGEVDQDEGDAIGRRPDAVH